MEKFGEAVADTAEDIGEGFVDIVENPDQIVTFMSYAQTESIFDTLQDLGEDALEKIVGEDITEEIVQTVQSVDLENVLEQTVETAENIIGDHAVEELTEIVQDIDLGNVMNILNSQLSDVLDDFQLAIDLASLSGNMSSVVTQAIPNMNKLLAKN